MGQRFLCVCNGGNCRSVAVAEVLKGVYGFEAFGMGTYWFSPESQEMLAYWADKILFVEPFQAQLPHEDLLRWKSSPLWGLAYESKRIILPLGPDVWGHDRWNAIKDAAKQALIAAGIVPA